MVKRDLNSIVNNFISGLSHRESALLFCISIVVCLFFVGKAFFFISAGIVCDNSGGELFESSYGIVCVGVNDLDKCINIDGDVKGKSWKDNLNITINISGV